MIFVVEDVEKIAVERMDVVEAGEFVYDCGELFMEIGLGEFYFAHVE